MAKKEFQAESKKLMDMMINSIYTNKEIFLRELISNASDAIDKLYYKSLTDTSVGMNKGDFRILLTRDKDNRLLTVSDNGIGMTKDELEKMQRRLDVILAVSEENWENRKKEWNQSVESTRAGFVQRRDELVSGIEKRFERAKELLPSGRLNVNREELFDLRSKFGVNLQRPELASFLKDFTKRDMLRGNPSMVSKKFSEALEELKKSAVEYKKREKK